jgi:hypothetical protein
MAGPSSELEAASAPTQVAPTVGSPPGDQPGRPLRGRFGRLLTAAVAVALAASVALRLWPRSALWLDEAQSVAISRLAFTEIPSALRTDGAPPLFYLLLHVWMAVFGHSTIAVRALPILFSLAGLVVIGLAARRYGGRRAVWPAVLLLATNPFAIRYATEARMYSLVVLEVAAGLLAMPWVLDRPTWRRLSVVALLTAALLYTHYWSIYLLGAVGVVLVAMAVARRRSPAGRSAVAVLGAMAAGGLLWLPWVPSFLYQAEHTSTPWTAPPTLWNVFDVLPALAGGSRPRAMVLVFLIIALLVFALFSRGDTDRTRLDLRTFPPARGLAAVTVLCPVFAVVGGLVSGSAFVSRYASVVFPVIVVLAAVGLAHIADDWLRRGLLAVACVAAFPLAVDEAGTARTPATTMAVALQADARPGDVIVYCPDQLGPGIARRLEGTATGALQQGTFPDWSPPDRVDWTDYQVRHREASSVAFAEEAVRRAGTGSVWLLWSPHYPSTRSACVVLRAALAAARPGEQMVVKDRPWAYLDRPALLRYPADPADQIEVDEELANYDFSR